MKNDKRVPYSAENTDEYDFNAGVQAERNRVMALLEGFRTTRTFMNDRETAIIVYLEKIIRAGENE